MQKVVVLVFTHKAEPDADELLSFRQCCEVLGQHPIRLVCPRGMDVAAYRAVYPEIVPDFIDPKWFGTVRDYNLLKMLPWLYRRYADYEFMLTYELDAWVFRDELLYWCGQGWDYIGAPWFDGHYWCREDSPVLGVGNSGFSLRSVAACLRTLEQIALDSPVRVAKDLVCRRMSLSEAFRKLSNRRVLKISPSSERRAQDSFWCTKVAPRIRRLLAIPPPPKRCVEDIYWCTKVASRIHEFKVAPYADACKFAFESNAPRLYRENNGNLPFGCHKYVQLAPEFWKRFIPLAESAGSH